MFTWEQSNSQKDGSKEPLSVEIDDLPGRHEGLMAFTFDIIFSDKVHWSDAELLTVLTATHRASARRRPRQAGPGTGRGSEASAVAPSRTSPGGR